MRQENERKKKQMDIRRCTRSADFERAHTFLCMLSKNMRKNTENCNRISWLINFKPQ